MFGLASYSWACACLVMRLIYPVSLQWGGVEYQCSSSQQISTVYNFSVRTALSLPPFLHAGLCMVWVCAFMCALPQCLSSYVYQSCCVWNLCFPGVILHLWWQSFCLLFHIGPWALKREVPLKISQSWALQSLWLIARLSRPAQILNKMKSQHWEKWLQSLPPPSKKLFAVDFDGLPPISTWELLSNIHKSDFRLGETQKSYHRIQPCLRHCRETWLGSQRNVARKLIQGLPSCMTQWDISNVSIQN